VIPATWAGNPYDSRPDMPGIGEFIRTLAMNGRIGGTRADVRTSMPFRPYVYKGTGADTLTAFMDDLPERRERGRKRATQPCGTPAAYRRHLRHGTPACEPCRQAEALRSRGDGVAS
jgi:hypothetical protein